MRRIPRVEKRKTVSDDYAGIVDTMSWGILEMTALERELEHLLNKPALTEHGEVLRGQTVSRNFVEMAKLEGHDIILCESVVEDRAVGA